MHGTYIIAPDNSIALLRVLRRTNTLYIIPCLATNARLATCEKFCLKETPVRRLRPFVFKQTWPIPGTQQNAGVCRTFLKSVFAKGAIVF